jgi:hypothetical protein
MKNPIVLFAILVSLAFSMLAGCKKESNEQENNGQKNNTPDPLAATVGTYSTSYHEHYDLAGAPPPTNVCDTTYSMTVTVDTIAGTPKRLKLTVEANKLWCQSQYNSQWCFNATADTITGKVTGTDFKEFCDDNGYRVTSSDISIIGDSISCTVNYNANTGTGSGPNIPSYFNFSGKKN